MSVPLPSKRVQVKVKGHTRYHVGTPPKHAPNASDQMSGRRLRHISGDSASLATTGI